MSNSKTKKKQFSLFLVFLLFSSILLVQGQCPTVTNKIQSFCDISSPKTIDLLALDNGGGISWYSTLTGGNVLTDNTRLQDGFTYYADDNLGSCTNRQAVSVIITGFPPTNVPVATSRCSSENSTIANLSATGTNIAWFSEQTGGIQLPTIEPLSNQTYWVQQTATSGCISNRLPTTVTIINPGKPTGEADQYFCVDSSSPTIYQIQDLVANGSQLKWYSSLTSITVLQETTPLVDNVTYYATQNTFPCESTERFETTVHITQLPIAGTDSTLEICTTNLGSINLFDQLNGNPDIGGTWSGLSPTTNGYLGTIDTNLLTIGFSSFTYTITGVNSCQDVTSTLVIAIQEAPEAGENAALTICSSDTNMDLFTLLGSTAETGGNWSPSLTSGSGIFNPIIDPSGLYTYTVLGTNSCTASDTATVNVSIVTAPYAGNDASLDICITDAPVNLLTFLGTTIPTGGTWSPQLNSGTNIFNPAIDISANYTYTIAAIGTCPSDSASLSIMVHHQANAGNNTVYSICSNDAPLDLFTILDGNPDPNGTWSPALISSSGIFDPNVDAGGTYTYTVNSSGTCPSASAMVNITIEQAPNSGISTAITLCATDAPIDLISLLGTNISTLGNWSGPSSLTNNHLGQFSPQNNSEGIYTYTISASSVCDTQTATVQVAVSNPMPQINNEDAIFCSLEDYSVAALKNRITTETNGIINVYNEINPTIALLDSAVLLDANTYIITETDSQTNCTGVNRLFVTITISTPTTPTIATTTVTFCAIENPTTASLNALLVTGNNVQWQDAAIGGTILNDTAPLISGTYYAIEEDIYGCNSLPSNALIVTIDNPELPIITDTAANFCGVDNPTLAELEANIIVNQNLTIIWYDQDQEGNILQTTELLHHNATYYAAVYNSVTACKSTNRLAITTDLTICELTAYPFLIPDGFSPNGDGINDYYELINAEFLYKDYSIEVYNRYGKMVFNGDKNRPAWDGTSSSSSKMVPNGVYFYIVNFNKDNIPPKQGKIYLNR